jgi:hypothetical protein
MLRARSGERAAAMLPISRFAPFRTTEGKVIIFLCAE